jgi:hypothetical protein
MVWYLKKSDIFSYVKKKPRSDLTSDKKTGTGYGTYSSYVKKTAPPLPWLVVRQNNNSWFSWSIRYRLAAGIVSTFSMHPWFRIYPGEIDKTREIEQTRLG